MRLTNLQIQTIKQVVATVTADNAQVILFGSRVDDTQKGGDIDLLITQLNHIQHPVELATKINAQLVRVFQGRKIDILLSAPNLKTLPIHLIARKTGIVL
jgi:predicted nucleotidyltransferase